MAEEEAAPPSARIRTLQTDPSSYVLGPPRGPASVRTFQADPGGYVLGPLPQSVDVHLSGVSADAEAGTPSVGTASGAGTANGVGAAVATAVGGTTIRHDTPLPLRADFPIQGQAEQSISIGQTATATVTDFPIQGQAEQSIAIGQTATAIVTEKADATEQTDAIVIRRTVIIRTVLANQVVVRLTALSLLNEIELKIETLRAHGSNSEIAEFEDLKRRVEEFLAANAKRDEAPIADTALAISDGLRRLLMHEHVRDIGLLGVGLSFCAAAGALGVSDPVILAVSGLAGGKRVADVLNAAANLIRGKGKDEKK
jgi:hypothetical protein